MNNSKTTNLFVLEHRHIYYLLIAFFMCSLAIKIVVLMLNIMFFPMPHMTNFGISGALLLLSRRQELLNIGYSNNQLYSDAFIWIAINVVVETLLDINDFNTADPLDMIMGVLAIAIIVIAVKLDSRSLTEKNEKLR